MGTIRDKMTADLELRGFAATTKKEYLQRAHNFIAHHRRPPTELGEQDIRKFLLYIRVRGLAFGNDPEARDNFETGDPLGGHGRVYFTDPSGHLFEVCC